MAFNWIFRSHGPALAALCGLTLVADSARADECTPPLGEHSTPGFTLTSSSFLGSDGADRLWAAEILGDGTIILGGRFTAVPAIAADAPTLALFDAADDAQGLVLALTADAQSVLWVRRVGPDVFGLARDPDDNVAIALGDAGLGSFDASGQQRWRQTTPAVAVAVADTGQVASLRSTWNADHHPAEKAGEVYIYSAAGTQETGPISGWGGREHTAVAIARDGAMVYAAGFHITSSCKNPVHVGFIRAWDHAGELQWTNYGWAGDDLDPSCSDYEDNNMADSRGYVLTVGEDGLLYAGFEVAGGNHIFRYDPRDLTASVGHLRQNNGLGNHAEMFNTKSEHKTVIGRYDPVSGELLRWQQWVARLTGHCGTGAGNTIRTRAGGIAADRDGRVYLTAASASGMYLTHDPFLDDPYRGGYYMTVFGPDLDMSPYSTRHFGGGQGHAVAVRSRVDADTPMVVFAGAVDKPDFHYSYEAIQSESLDGADGAFVVLNASGVLDPGTDTDDPDPTTTGDAGTSDGETGADTDNSDSDSATSVPTSGPTSGPGSNSGDPATTGGSDDGSGTAGVTEDPPADADSGGCACRSQRTANLSGLWLVLGGLAVLGRRRFTVDSRARSDVQPSHVAPLARAIVSPRARLRV